MRTPGVARGDHELLCPILHWLGRIPEIGSLRSRNGRLAVLEHELTDQRLVMQCDLLLFEQPPEGEIRRVARPSRADRTGVASDTCVAAAIWFGVFSLGRPPEGNAA